MKHTDTWRYWANIFEVFLQLRQHSNLQKLFFGGEKRPTWIWSFFLRPNQPIGPIGCKTPKKESGGTVSMQAGRNKNDRIKMIILFVSFKTKPNRMLTNQPNQPIKRTNQTNLPTSDPQLRSQVSRVDAIWGSALRESVGLACFYSPWVFKRSVKNPNYIQTKRFWYLFIIYVIWLWLKK